MNTTDPDKSLRLIKLMKQALEQDLLQPIYKPLLQVRFPQRRSFHFQCELPTGGGQRIPWHNLEKLARSTGTAAELDRWLLDRALEALRELHREQPDGLLVVSQSPQALADEEYPRLVERQRTLKEVSSQGLVIGFRLSHISRDLKRAHQCIAALHEQGVETMIEGFTEHPAALKILRAMGSRYVSVSPGLQKGEDGVVEHRTKACHRMGVRILLPEIDAPEEVNLLWSAGADLLAGNYIQPPTRDLGFRFPPVIV